VGHAQDVGAGFRVAEFGGAGQAHHGFLLAGDDLGGLADDGLAQVVVPAAQALVAVAQASMVRTRGSNSWRSMGLVRKSLAPARGSGSGLPFRGRR
jgi:hypothetical protein